MVRFRWSLSVLLAGVFLLAGWSGYLTPSHDVAAIEFGVWVSGSFWFVAAVLPLWRQSDHASAYWNAAAAAAAVYAGIAALQ